MQDTGLAFLNATPEAKMNAALQGVRALELGSLVARPLRGKTLGEHTHGVRKEAAAGYSAPEIDDLRQRRIA